MGGKPWSAAQWRVLAVAYFAYMSKTFGEAAFDLTTPARQTGALSLSDGATASLLSIGSFSYLSGKLLLGAVGDLLGGRALFAGSLVLAGSAFWGMSLAGSHFDLCVGWAVANFVLAAPWSGMLLCVSGWFGTRPAALCACCCRVCADYALTTCVGQARTTALARSSGSSPRPLVWV